MDVVTDPAAVDRLEAHLAPLGITLHRISAVTGDGVTALVEDMWRHLQRRWQTDE